MCLPYFSFPSITLRLRFLIHHLHGFLLTDLISIFLLRVMLICVTSRLKSGTFWFIYPFLSFIYFFHFICAANIYWVPTRSQVLLSMFIHITNSLETLKSVQTHTSLFNNKQQTPFSPSPESQLASKFPLGHLWSKIYICPSLCHHPYLLFNPPSVVGGL